MLEEGEHPGELCGRVDDKNLLQQFWIKFVAKFDLLVDDTLRNEQERDRAVESLQIDDHENSDRFVQFFSLFDNFSAPHFNAVLSFV